MKPGRVIGAGVSLLLVIIVAVMIYIWMSLDAIVAAAIEKYGSQVTRTPVRVSAVSIDLKSGAGAIEQLRVGNPGGFSAKDIFALDGITTRINLDSLSADPIVIEEINISAPHVVYEINNAGKSNLDALEENIAQSTQGGNTTGEPAAKDSAGPGIVIRTLVIEGGQIDAEVAALPDKPLSAKLSRIQLNNIGEKQGGATGAQIAEQVIAALIREVGPAVATLGLNKYLGKDVEQIKALGEKLEGQAGETAVTRGKEGLKKLLGSE